MGGASGAMLGRVSGGLFSPVWPQRPAQPRRTTLPVGGCYWPTPQGPFLLQGTVYPPRASSALHPTSLEYPIHTSPPCVSCSLISLLSISPPFPLGRPAFLVTFGILLNTRDLWPLPSGLPTHLSPQLLPLLNSVRLAPPPVIKRRTFQVDPFPLPRLQMASQGLGKSLGRTSQLGR